MSSQPVIRKRVVWLPLCIALAYGWIDFRRLMTSATLTQIVLPAFPTSSSGIASKPVISMGEVVPPGAFTVTAATSLVAVAVLFVVASLLVFVTTQ